jgi:hypothetical protein
MSNINLHNYEAWLLDFQEGKLSEAQEQMLMAFLEAHPEIEIDLDGFDDVKLSALEDPLMDKSSLYRIPADIRKEFEMLAVLMLDDEISPNETTRLNKIIELFPMLEKEITDWRKTKLEPEVSLFGQNAALKQISADIPEFELLALHQLEGIADDDQEKQFYEALAAAPIHQKIYAALQQTKLNADLDIVFSGKSSLKRSIPFFTAYRKPLRFALSAAAILIFIVAVVPFIYVNDNRTTPALTLSDQIRPAQSNRKALPKTNGEANNSASPKSSMRQGSAVNENSIEKQIEPLDSFAALIPIGSPEFEIAAPAMRPVSVLMPNAEELAIRFFPEDGQMENPGVSELIRLRNLALRQINRISELPEQINIKGEDLAHGVEKITNGNVRINAEKDERRQNFGFSIGPFSYERSRGK